MTWTFERVAGPYEFTEGPVWTGSELLFTDVFTDRIFRFDPDSGSTDVFAAETDGANGLTLGPDGAVYACEGAAGRVARYDLADPTNRAPIAETYDGVRFNSPNDLAFDSRGRLWFTDPRYDDSLPPMELDHQAVYRADHAAGPGWWDGDQTHADARADDWTVTRVADDTTMPNGIVVSQDGMRLYVAQTDHHDDQPTELRAYPIGADGSLGEYDVLHDFGPHRGIDGMRLDAAGNVVACAGSDGGGPGPRVDVFAPDGEVIESHPFPVDTPTNCAFGGEGLQTLYACAGDGCLYRATVDRAGAPVPPA